MKIAAAGFLARATCSADGRLVRADEPLAGLQMRCGGELPGVIAIPALLELVRKANRLGLQLAQPIHALDGDERITAWAEVAPDKDDGQGCEIRIASWQANTAPAENFSDISERHAVIDRHLAELSARLDTHQKVLAVEGRSPDVADLAARMARGTGHPWTDFVDIPGSTHRQPMHWRLLDGASVSFEGSKRHWKAALVPLGEPEPGSKGFELYLVADEPPPAENEIRYGKRTEDKSPLIGREIAPVLRQPIARIIANAETIRTRMAGPLAQEYSSYAADIAAAGEHLLGLIDDLADLEIVEAEDFSTAPDQIDLADVVRRAAGILGVRAQEKNIKIDCPDHDETLPAIGEFRRVLQVLLNLLGNAIRYSPAGSEVWIRLEHDQDRASVIVADQGPGLAEEDQDRIFDKFERLGRSGDGGSGLGLYISRRLAQAMRGDLRVESAPGKGARFTLELPKNQSAS